MIDQLRRRVAAWCLRPLVQSRLEEASAGLNRYDSDTRQGGYWQGVFSTLYYILDSREL